MKRSYILLLVVGLACCLAGCSRALQPEEALAYMRRTYPNLVFELAEGSQPTTGVACSTSVMESVVQCQVQQAGGKLQDDLSAQVVKTLSNRVDQVLVQYLVKDYNQLAVDSLASDSITFAGVLPKAQNASFHLTLVKGGQVRLAVPVMAVKIPTFFEADQVGILPAGTLVTPMASPPQTDFRGTYVTVKTDRFGEVSIPAPALLATVECQGMEMLTDPYEVQNSSATQLQYWPGSSGSQAGLMDVELGSKQVLQVLARWQDWLLVNSRPFPWYPGSASCGWIRADQVVSFDPEQSPDAWVKAGTKLYDEVDSDFSNPTIVLTEPLLMRYTLEKNGKVLLGHPKDAGYWTESTNVIGRNPFEKPN